MKIEKHEMWVRRNRDELPTHSVSFKFSQRRPLSVADLAELIIEHDFGIQMGVLEYMRQFRTWDKLYDDLERRLNEKANHPIRNVTPEKPKQLRQNNE